MHMAALEAEGGDIHTGNEIYSPCTTSSSSHIAMQIAQFMLQDMNSSFLVAVNFANDTVYSD